MRRGHMRRGHIGRGRALSLGLGLGNSDGLLDRPRRGHRRLRADPDYTARPDQGGLWCSRADRFGLCYRRDVDRLAQG
jgi:hypothetical protein